MRPKISHFWSKKVELHGKKNRGEEKKKRKKKKKKSKGIETMVLVWITGLFDFCIDFYG